MRSIDGRDFGVEEKIRISDTSSVILGTLGVGVLPWLVSIPAPGMEGRSSAESHSGARCSQRLRQELGRAKHTHPSTQGRYVTERGEQQQGCLKRFRPLIP